jgi:hypothetical protein
LKNFIFIESYEENSYIDEVVCSVLNDTYIFLVRHDVIHAHCCFMFKRFLVGISAGSPLSYLPLRSWSHQLIQRHRASRYGDWYFFIAIVKSQIWISAQGADDLSFSCFFSVQQIPRQCFDAGNYRFLLHNWKFIIFNLPYIQRYIL